MDEFEPKKLAVLRIYQILQDYSDNEHPMTQKEIGEKLYSDYGIVLERKAIARNLQMLESAGMHIHFNERQGCYLSSRRFEDSELRLLIDGVLSSRYIPTNYSKDLINKLCGLTNKYFKPSVKHIYSVDHWDKTDAKDLFLNIEIIGDAIERNRQIAFTTRFYGTDKKFHKGFEMEGTPCAMLINDQQYFLLYIWDLNEGDEGEEPYYVVFTYPIEEITDIRILEEKKGVDPTEIDAFKNGLDIPKFLNEYSIGKSGVVFSD